MCGTASVIANGAAMVPGKIIRSRLSGDIVATYCVRSVRSRIASDARLFDHEKGASVGPSL